MEGLRHCGQITYSARFMLPYFCDSADSFDFHSCIPASETRLYLSETGNCHSLRRNTFVALMLFVKFGGRRGLLFLSGIDCSFVMSECTIV